MIILNKLDDLHYANGCFIDEETYNEIQKLQNTIDVKNLSLEKLYELYNLHELVKETIYEREKEIDKKKNEVAE